MKGSIKAYSAAVNAGVIQGTDGNRYQFNRIEWSGKNLPAANQSVCFETSCDSTRATKVNED